MVSKWWMARRSESAAIENLQRIHSIAFFANSRRIKPNAMTCDLSRVVSQAPIAWSTATERPGSRDVLPAAYGILARAGARAVAERQNARIGKAATDQRRRRRAGSNRGGVRH